MPSQLVGECHSKQRWILEDCVQNSVQSRKILVDGDVIHETVTWSSSFSSDEVLGRRYAITSRRIHVRQWATLVMVSSRRDSRIWFERKSFLHFQSEDVVLVLGVARWSFQAWSWSRRPLAVSAIYRPIRCIRSFVLWAEHTFSAMGNDRMSLYASHCGTRALRLLLGQCRT